MKRITIVDVTCYVSTAATASRLSIKFINPCVYPTLAAKAQFAGGAGTSSDPYIITNAMQLSEVRNYLTSSFRLEADINAGAAWVPIGDTRYTGTFKIFQPTRIGNRCVQERTDYKSARAVLRVIAYFFT